MSNSDRNYLNSLINAAKANGRREVYITHNPDDKEGVWRISEPLFVPSGFTVYISCRIALEPGVFSNIICNENAYAGISDASAPDDNIRIIGLENAELDGGEPNCLREKTSEKNGLPHIVKNTSLLFRNVRDFTVSNLKISNPRWWGMTFINASNGSISDIEFFADNRVPNQDGIDLRKGCNNIEIKNISGSTGDDSLALTALSGRLEELLTVRGGENDIHDIKIKNIRTEVTGGHHIVRILNHDGNRIYNVDIDGIYDNTPDSGGVRARAALKIGDKNYASLRPALPGETDGITVRNIKTRARCGVLIGNPNLTNSEFSSVENSEGPQFGF